MTKFSAIMAVFGSLVLAAQTPAISQSRFPALLPASSEYSAADIMRNAQKAAGGKTWVKPKSLVMKGYAVFYRKDRAVKNEAHNMWRVYDREKSDAHTADGKVRIESLHQGKPVFNISFDGTTTYTATGPQPSSVADNQWASAFGFGVGRHAFDPGYMLERLADDLVDGHPVFTVKITAPTGSSTNFSVAQKDFAILKIGFNTPRGWHERIYSNFFTNPATDWQQPGRVRLYYDGIKSNEVIWQSFEINKNHPDCLFILPEAENCRAKNMLNPMSSSTLEQDLLELLQWFPGTYDNHQQVYRQALDKVRADMRQRQTRHIFQPLKITGIPGRTLYAQQSQHYDPKDLYRQRIYSFEVDKGENAIRLTIYTPKDPDRLTDAHLDPAKVADMTADDFILKPGCEVYWKKAGTQFEGYLKQGTCSYFSKRFGKRVFLNETLIMRQDALVLHDTALDADQNLVFGSADKGPTVNLRQRD